MSADRVARILCGMEDPKRFGDIFNALLQVVPPEVFKNAFNNAPFSVKAMVFEPPADLTVEWNDMNSGPERMKTCWRINSLMRERCLPLVPKGKREYWAEESWVLVPMSLETKARFWDCYQHLPLTTTDASTWQATVAHLKKCPEGVDNTIGVDAHISLDERFGPVASGLRLPRPVAWALGDQRTSPPPGSWGERFPGVDRSGPHQSGGSHRSRDRAPSPSSHGGPPSRSRSPARLPGSVGADIGSRLSDELDSMARVFHELDVADEDAFVAMTDSAPF